MKFSENWLREFVNPAQDSDALNALLTMAGLEVESQAPVASAFAGVVVAHILSAEKHPDADRLQVLKVDVGQAEPLQIVCGGANARAGLKSACALVGAKLPGFVIQQAEVRGVASFGMMCSEKELGLTAESAGIIELPEHAPVGQDFRSYWNLDDQVFELKLTPNRADCLSLLGIARDVSALTGAALCVPQISATPVNVAETQSIRVEDETACPRYCGRILRNVNANAPTPLWMRQRLERSGLRSISALVDITNYVLLERGQPLHAFDLDKLAGEIVVRQARSGEQLRLLNEQTVALQPGTLVITDHHGPVALAGVMGGNDSAVSQTTRHVFLESAFFTPAALAGKARAWGLSTDASYRFERGVDFAATRICLERASQLVLEICGGEAAEISEVITGNLPPRPPVKLRVHKAAGILGIALSKAQISALLSRLQFDYQSTGDEFFVTPPSYRFDINREEDLIEEIARLHGYARLPAVVPLSPAQLMLPAPECEASPDRLRDRLVEAGYFETINYSFVDETWEHQLAGNSASIALKNPIASNMGVMRSNLWGGLLQSLLYNLNRKQERARLFEIGACFARQGETYQETARIGGLAFGSLSPEQWASPAREVDFYDVKADVEALTLGRAVFQAAAHPALHPGQSARIVIDGKASGWLGTLHPRWQQQYDLPSSVILFELELAAVSSCRVPAYTEVAKFPPVRRDMALVVDEAISAQALLDALEQARSTIISELALFDQYRGKGVEAGKKSLAFRVVMQDTQKTLTDQDADAAMAQLVAAANQRYGAVLRS